MAELLAPLGSNGLRIRSVQGEAVNEAGKGWTGSLQNLEAGKGYLLQLGSAQELGVKKIVVTE